MLADTNSRAWNWWSEREKDGGIFGALGSHLIDSLLWWFGDIDEVSAQISTFVSRRPTKDCKDWGDVTADDDVALHVRFASGARCSVDLSGLARPGKLLLEAYGSQGALAIEDDARLLTATGTGAWEPAEIPERLIRNIQGDGRIAPTVMFVSTGAGRYVCSEPPLDCSCLALEDARNTLSRPLSSV